jgi:hypothetical protein
MGGVVLPNTLLGSFVATRDIVIAAGAPGSLVVAEVAPTSATVVLQLVHNGSSVGNLTFNIGATNGIVNLTAGLTLVSGDKLQVTSGGAASDPSFADVTLTLVGRSVADSV